MAFPGGDTWPRPGRTLTPTNQRNALHQKVFHEKSTTSHRPLIEPLSTTPTQPSRKGNTHERTNPGIVTTDAEVFKAEAGRRRMKAILRRQPARLRAVLY
ncbi:MAG: hypothetical protein WBH51_15850 [Mycolicibacter algericus]|uniref:hypothetical protein n=1 Tax=Mycolicibacter TaxID=1073531 RepID=UPI001055137D|nr:MULTISPECIES: hypothetical protein [Mycolicibacter]